MLDDALLGVQTESTQVYQRIDLIVLVFVAGIETP